MERIEVLKIKARTVSQANVAEMDKIRRADLVINKNDMAIKDRTGRVPRPATREELDSAVKA